MPFEELLDYLARFARVMEVRPFFAYARVNDITRDELNNAGYADSASRRDLQLLPESGVPYPTIVVFLSDHGIRLGVVPEANSSLRVNQQCLTTLFNVHATLVELLDYPILERPNTACVRSLLHEVPVTGTYSDKFIGLPFSTCNVMPNDVVKQTVSM